jgi:hypothetical protein
MPEVVHLDIAQPHESGEFGGHHTQLPLTFGNGVQRAVVTHGCVTSAL